MYYWPHIVWGRFTRLVVVELEARRSTDARDACNCYFNFPFVVMYVQQYSKVPAVLITVVLAYFSHIPNEVEMGASEETIMGISGRSSVLPMPGNVLSNSVCDTSESCASLSTILSPMLIAWRRSNFFLCSATFVTIVRLLIVSQCS